MIGGVCHFLKNRNRNRIYYMQYDHAFIMNIFYFVYGVLYFEYLLAREFTTLVVLTA